MGDSTCLLHSFDPQLFHGDRLDAGLTLMELSRRSRVNRVALWRWEQGVVTPSRKKYELVQRVLAKAEDECPPDWIWRRYNPTWSLQHEDDWLEPDA